MIQKELEKMLNSLGKNGRKLYGKYGIGTVQCYCDEISFQVGEEGPIEMGYHELFSIDSGLMEFVEWKGRYNYINHRDLAYFNMSTMTAEKKVQYFLDNALITEQKQNGLPRNSRKT